MMKLWIAFLLLTGRLVSHPRLWRFLLHPLTRYVAAWLLTAAGAWASLDFAWHSFDKHSRNDGNEGHTTIDFGGQYLMGRMLVEGYGRHLYHRDFQHVVLRGVYPRGDEDPAQEHSDADNLMTWTMGESNDVSVPDRVRARLALLAGQDVFGAAVLVAAEQAVNQPSVGGPLYPPVHAFYYYPLACLDSPRTAYRVNQVVGLLLSLLGGLAVRFMSRGRIWWPVATGAIIGFPGFSGSLNLGQNANLTLTLLLCGWALLARGRPGWGGVVWGFLAFKPVWALSFFAVPLLSRRWRFCLAMAGTGVALAALTLPVVGLHSWQEWLRIGDEATQTYRYDSNWIHLSRDILSIPRRWLDFEPGKWVERRDDVASAVAGLAILVAVFEVTVRVAALRRGRLRAATGPQPAFLLLAAWLCCFHFMYYDMLLAALPVFLLFTEWREYLKPLFVAIVRISRARIGEALARHYDPRFASAAVPPAPPVQPDTHTVWVLNRMVPNLVVALLVIEYLFPGVGIKLYEFPYDTVCLGLFWLWCGWLALKEAGEVPRALPVEKAGRDAEPVDLPSYAPQLVELSADVGGPHERLAHQHRADAGRLKA